MEIDTWIYSMEMYFLAETRIPEGHRAVRAALNLEGDAAVWFRAQGWHPGQITWE